MPLLYPPVSFVFLWSPTLSNASPKGASLPFGIIFATYMVCTMIGSKLFGLSLSIGLVPSSLPYYIHAIAFISKLIVVLFMTDSIMVVYLRYVNDCNRFTVLPFSVLIPSYLLHYHMNLLTSPFIHLPVNHSPHTNNYIYPLLSQFPPIRSCMWSLLAHFRHTPINYHP